jgi:hypothetical protein
VSHQIAMLIGWGIFVILVLAATSAWLWLGRKR